MLSRKTIDMLEYNGYSGKSENQIVFRHSSADRVGLVIVLMISAFAIIALFAIQFVAGILALAAFFLIFKPYVKRSKGQFRFAIDPTAKLLIIESSDRHSMRKPFSDVTGVYTHSQFVDEYSSAFKSTSKEYQVTIGLEVAGENPIPLFKLIADHERPSREMDEVHGFVKSVIRGGK